MLINNYNLLDDTTNNTIKKMRAFLEENGISETFRYIKNLDTIELLGVSDNGGERVLLNEILHEYGEETVKNNVGFKYLIPCIPEGVIKCKTDKGVIYYTHFRITNSSENKFDLSIKEYHFSDGNFYLRYIIKINGLNNNIDENIDDEVTVNYACVKQFLLEAFSKQELKQNFSDMELKWISKIADGDDSHLKREVDVIIEYILSTFQAINFLSDYQKKEHYINNDKKTTRIINEEENYINTNGERVINTNKYYRLRQGKKNYENIDKEEKQIIRRTDKWIVSGHVRHYKNGKEVFVQSYYKGPKRESKTTPKTTFKIEESRPEKEFPNN